MHNPRQCSSVDREKKRKTNQTTIISLQKRHKILRNRTCGCKYEDHTETKVFMKVPNKKRTQNKSEFLTILFGSKCTIHDNALVVNCEEEEAGEIRNKNKKPTTIISLLRKRHKFLLKQDSWMQIQRSHTKE
jgi:hypothetical protein